MREYAVGANTICTRSRKKYFCFGPKFNAQVHEQYVITARISRVVTGDLSLNLRARRFVEVSYALILLHVEKVVWVNLWGFQFDYGRLR